MAHFAEINDQNIVTRVLVVPDDQEHRGQDFLANDLQLGGTWIQTSYNGTIRKNYAGIGDVYDPNRDAFYRPQPFPSWTLDENTCHWICPVPYPEEHGLYNWNEETQTWEPL